MFVISEQHFYFWSNRIPKNLREKNICERQYSNYWARDTRNRETELVPQQAQSNFKFPYRKKFMYRLRTYSKCMPLTVKSRWIASERNMVFILRTALVWVITQRVVIISNRRLGTKCRFHSKGSRIFPFFFYSLTTRILRSWVRIPPGAWMFVCCECCVLSGRGLCDELITRTDDSYRLWCVIVCDLETSRMRRPWPALGRSAKKKYTVRHNFY